MRVFLLLVWSAAVLTACNKKPEGKASAAIESELMARRDKLLQQRQELAQAADSVQSEIVAARNSGGDTGSLEAKLDAIRAQQEQNKDEIIRQLQDQNDRYRVQLSNLGGAGIDTNALLSELRSRDQELGQMRAQFGDVKRTLAELTEAVGRCSGGTTIIQQAVRAESGDATRVQANDLLKKATTAMGKKGILADDIGADALLGEATKALKAGDYGRAHAAAQQLLATVEATSIDRGFVSAKVGRLSKRWKGKELPAAQQREVDDWFKEVTTKYGDGDFVAANKKLNLIAARL